MRLLTCSNSGPILAPPSPGHERSSPPGGLVPIVSAVLKDIDGRWIFTASSEFGPTGDLGQNPTKPAPSLQPLSLPPGVVEQQRRVVTVGLLLWLFHYLHDTSVAPSFGADVKSAWQLYGQVNQAFADALFDAHGNDPDEVVLVHDFHLMLVPSLFSAKVKDRRSRLAYFHHVPWCEPEYFGILPNWMRNQILESLLSCDVVSFHCDRWAQAFLSCCERYLADARVAERVVSYRDHAIAVTTAPGPIDAATLDDIAGSPETAYWRTRLRKLAGDRRVVARVDRLDLWKNLVRGFTAYEQALTRDPRLAAEFWFCAIVSTPRFPTDRHRRYQEACEGVVDRLNSRFGDQRDVATLLYPDGGDNSRNRAIAALQVASATLVNPTYDGLNMVAKESLIVNPDAHLLLSTNAGVYPQVASVALPVHPFDLCCTTDALGHAMESPSRTSTQGREACVASLRRESGTAWLQRLLQPDRPGDDVSS
jgi:trehalose 6-phosphate synthase